MKERQSSDLFIEPDLAVQDTFRTITEYVQANYEPNQASEFLDGADPWVIAHARAYGGKVVIQEVRVASSSKGVKVPNVCDEVNIEVVNIYQMIRELGILFDLRP